MTEQYAVCNLELLPHYELYFMLDELKRQGFTEQRDDGSYSSLYQIVWAAFKHREDKLALELSKALWPIHFNPEFSKEEPL